MLKRKGISVVYCTDSRPVDRIIPFAKKTDLFICEGMYGEEEKRKKRLKKTYDFFRGSNVGKTSRSVTFVVNTF